MAPEDVIPERKKGSGRPVTITNHALKVLERYIKKNPHATACGIKKEVPEVAAVSERHINRLILKKLKIPSRIAAQKPLLTPKMKKKSWPLPESTAIGLQRTGALSCTVMKAPSSA